MISGSLMALIGLFIAWQLFGAVINRRNSANGLVGKVIADSANP